MRGGERARATSRRHALVFVLSSLIAAGLFVWEAARPTTAATAAPAHTISRYVDTLSGSYHQGLGCAVAERRVSGPTILIYGKPVRIGERYGASLYGAPDASTGQISGAVKEFAKGYIRCAAGTSTFVNLIVATTNCCGADEVKYGHGRAWAWMINNLGTWLNGQGYAGKVRIRGGSDMEPGYNSRWRTWQWWRGYHSVNRYYLYNVGSADGCPDSGDGRTDRECLNGWHQSDILGLSWDGDAVPLPQIYRRDGIQARQWQQIKLYGVVSRGRSMTIMGSLTQARACEQRGCTTTDNSPLEGWGQLWRALASDPRTRQTLPYATDIGWP